MGKHSEAVKQFSAALAIAPHNATFLCNRGLCQRHIGLNRAALKDANAALLLDSANQTAILLKVDTLVALGKHDEARAFAIDHVPFMLDLLSFNKLQDFVEGPPATAVSPSPAAVVSPASATIAVPTTSPHPSRAIEIAEQGGEAPSAQPSSAPLDSPHADRKTASSPLNNVPPSSDIVAMLTEGKQSKSMRSYNEAVVVPDTKDIAPQVKTTSAGTPTISALVEDDSLLSSPELEDNILCITRTNSIQNGVGDLVIDKQLATGYLQVNTGKYPMAIKHFSEMIIKHPRIMACYLGRGTAYALSNQIDNAIEDFSRAISLDQSNPDSYKRRGQAQAARGLAKEAIADFTRAIELSSRDADAYLQRGVILNRLHDYQSAMKDLEQSVSIAPDNKIAHNTIGMCLNALGESILAIDSYQLSLDIDSNFTEAWINMAQAYRDWGIHDKAEVYFSKAISIDPTNYHAYHLRGLLRYGVGDIRGALRDTTKGKSINPTSIDLMLLKALCHNTQGQFRQANTEYKEILQKDPRNAFAWYQREVALFIHHNLKKPLAEFNLDASFDALFKESCCHKSDWFPLKAYKKQGDIDNRIKDIDDSSLVPFSKDVDTLIQEATPFGSQLQLDTPGFLPNKRQHRMCGLAVLEMAQTVRKHWNSLRSGGQALEVDGKFSSKARRPHPFEWRDFFDIGIKWRQLSEPNDPVWWIDLLSPEAFEEGFGLQTPMYSGQMKVPRYYPYCISAFNAMKPLILDQWALTDELRQRITDAKELADLHNTLAKDFWVVTRCQSLRDPKHILDGTRLTIVRKQFNGYDFTIRTPGTPPRWDDFDKELHALWTQLNAEAGRHDRDIDRISEIILHIYFYWVIFAPLTRGTAALGLMAVMALFLAADIEVTKIVERGKQTDFEAILGGNPHEFVQLMSSWLYPSRQPTNLLDRLPDVASIIDTPLKLIMSLNACKRFPE